MTLYVEDKAQGSSGDESLMPPASLLEFTEELLRSRGPVFLNEEKSCLLKLR